MTSNLASEEIANHALELRREAKEAAEHREEGKVESLKLRNLAIMDITFLNYGF